MNQDDRVLEDDLHPLRVGDEIGREIASIELHPLDDLERRLERPGFLDGDHAVLADLVHRLGDNLSDGGIVVRRDRSDLGNHVAADRFRHRLQSGHNRFHRSFDAALNAHGVGAGHHILGAFPIDRLGENRGGRCPVTRDVGGLAGHLSHHLRAHVLKRILEVDLLRDGHAVLRDGRGPEFLVEHDVAPLGAERDFDGVCKLINALADHLSRLFAVNNLLCHVPKHSNR